MRVIIYCRTSLGEDRQNVDNQKLPLSRYVKQRKSEGWNLIETVIDRASGGKADRDGILRIMDMAHKRQFDILLVYSLDRLSREGISQTLRYLSILEANKVRFISYSEGYLNTLEGPFKELVVSLIGYLASVEREKIRTRIKEGLNRLKLEGKTLGRPRVDLEKITQAKYLRSQNMSYGTIAKEMNLTRARVYQLANNYESSE